MRVCPLVVFPLALTLAGCSLSPTGVPMASAGAALAGRVHGGEQPVSAAHIYLMAAGSGGYGTASSSLISANAAGTDAVGSYVLTDASGGFSITGDYTCTPGQQVYVYALGGNPGAGMNTASGMMAAVGNCPAAGNFLGAVPFINVNEMTTVALAYAAAGFAVDPQHIASSGTPLALRGIANAFANTANLLNGAVTPAGNGTVPQSELNSLANILSACINSNGALTGGANPSNCYALFNSATNAGTQPTDTAGAIINIAHAPTANVSTLYNLQPSSPPYVPALSSAPVDFTVALRFTGGGLATSMAESNLLVNPVNNVAVDASGNVWKPNYDANSLTELSPLGVPLSGSGGFTGGGLNNPNNVAVDLNGAIWTANAGGNSVSKFTSAGSPASGSPFTAGGVNAPINLAIDANDKVWIVNGNNTLSALTNAGAAASGSPYSTNSLSYPEGLAVLPGGSVWVTNADPSSPSVAAYTNSGAQVAGSPFTGGGMEYPYGLAFDSSGNGWIANDDGQTELSSAGAVKAGSPFSAPQNAVPSGLALDGTGNVWTTEVSNYTILETNNSGSYLSGSVGFQQSTSVIPEAVAIDGSGNVWYSTATDAALYMIVGAGSPVVTPLSYGVQNNKLGQRP